MTVRGHGRRPIGGPRADRTGGLVQASTVIGDTRRRIIATNPAGCPDARPGCPCAGDEAVHAARAEQVTPSGADALVECPECGRPSNPHPISTWGHCRACRTADSRAVQPLRW